MMSGYYELLNMDKVKELENTAYLDGKRDLLKDIEDKMSIGIDILEILKQERLMIFQKLRWMTSLI